MDTVKNITESVLKTLGIEATYEERTLAEQPVLSVTTTDGALLVGANGDKLRALNTIVRMIAEKQGHEGRFTIDVNNYQHDEVTKLQGTAKMLAERARSLKYDVELNPMRPFERMVVHAALATEPHIKTESIGEGRERRIVIKYVE
ncbi:MAG: single-stranded nucleic acid binding spoIIIJ-associated protein [Candidatus Parcubacteria bacterium]|jgi:spoIIIJ-associated protein